MTYQTHHTSPLGTRIAGLKLSLVAALLTAGTFSAGSALALDLNANVGLGGLVDANVSLSLGGDGVDAEVDVGVGGQNGGGVNVAVGAGGSGLGVGVGVGTGGSGGTGGTGGTGGGSGPGNTTVVSVNPDAPGNDPNAPGAGGDDGIAIRCAASGNMPALVGSEVVDRQGTLLGWIAGATSEDGRKLSKVVYATPSSTCKSLQGGISMAGDRVRVNALASEIG